ncbi:jg21785, partial [Pararge aegeria aegeria]
TVFDRLRKTNLKLQLDKSEFLRKEVLYLGHTITKDGLKPNNDKIKAVLNFPLPKTITEIKSFLGLIGYYRRFIKDFARVTQPLTSCLKKRNKIIINEKYIEAFQKCKELLTNAPLLQYPDPEKPYVLTTDASEVALGAVLSQGAIGSDRPIAYASRTLSDTESRYSTIERELLAIVWAVKHFRPYLYGHKFKIYTDHRPLAWLYSLKEPNSKLTRWRLRLQEHDFEVVYKKGKQNTNADALSRIKLNALGAGENASVAVNIDDQESRFQDLRDVTDDDNSDKSRTLTISDMS